MFKEILSLPIVGFRYFHHVVAPTLTVMMFLSVYFIPSMLFLRLEDKLSISGHYSQGIVYIFSLLSVLFFAYTSNKIMLLMIEAFQTKLLKRQLDKFTKTSLTRLYTYILMIVIYVLYNFLTFSGINIAILPSETLNVIKEVFVTFVAINSLVQIVINGKHKSGNAKQ